MEIRLEIVTLRAGLWLPVRKKISIGCRAQGFMLNKESVSTTKTNFGLCNVTKKSKFMMASKLEKSALMAARKD